MRHHTHLGSLVKARIEPLVHMQDETRHRASTFSQQPKDLVLALTAVPNHATHQLPGLFDRIAMRGVIDPVVARLQPHSYSGSLGYASAACLADWIIVDMFASACVGQKTAKEAAAEAEKRAKRYYA